MVQFAYDFAKVAHDGHYRRDGVTPYFYKHILDVWMKVKDESPTVQAVALLHDVVEDIPEYTLESLRKAGFPPEVVEGVALMTKVKGANYTEYLEKIKANSVARAVKIADMISNLNDKPTPKQILKYGKGLAFLGS